jgi:hypothetical protein
MQQQKQFAGYRKTNQNKAPQKQNQAIDDGLPGETTMTGRARG